MPAERESLNIDRRSVLRSVGGGITTGTLLGVRADGDQDPVSATVDEAVKATPAVFGEVGRRINTVRYPVVGVPAIVEPGDTLRVELDTATVGEITASLVPSFGAATPHTDLTLQAVTDETSRTWHGETYQVARFSIPPLDRSFTEDLYDLVVAVDGDVDGQPRAVSVHDPFPDRPTIGILGDPHVGDPRPFEDGTRKSIDDQNPDPFIFRYQETVGTGTREDRWGAFQRANAEMNAENPDIILVIGDLAFGSGAYYQEYEDAYRVLNQLDAPTYVTVGNHDGYITPGAGIDGKALWRRYFAPWYYSVDLQPDLHFVSMDSYDWPAMDRIAPSAVPSTWGGQIRSEQLAWLQSDLQSWRERNEDGTILTLSHHNPSWRQTEGGEATRTTDGVPAAEQLARGVEQSGGGWVGANRLAVRTLLADVGVTLHVSGHAHRDRIARYHGDDTVVTTTGSGLEHVSADDEVLDTPREDKRAILDGGSGPLFVEATTAASGTTEYWGWRTVTVPRDGTAITPSTFGYPATDAFLAERALDSSLWSAENAELGLYSTPSYLLESEVLEATRDRVTIRVRSQLARAVAGAVTLPLGDCSGVRVVNWDKLWQRTDGEWQDVRVGFTVPAGETIEVTAECVSQEP